MFSCRKCMSTVLYFVRRLSSFRNVSTVANSVGNEGSKVMPLWANTQYSKKTKWHSLYTVIYGGQIPTRLTFSQIIVYPSFVVMTCFCIIGLYWSVRSENSLDVKVDFLFNRNKIVHKEPDLTILIEYLPHLIEMADKKNRTYDSADLREKLAQFEKTRADLYAKASSSSS